MVNKVLFDHGGGAWIESELFRLRQEILKFKKFVEKTSARHFSSRLFTLNFTLLNHLGDDLERFQSYLLAHAAPLKHFDGLTKQSYRKMSRRCSTGMGGTVLIVSNALSSVRRPGSEVHWDIVGASVMSTQKCTEGGGVLCAW